MYLRALAPCFVLFVACGSDSDGSNDASTGSASTTQSTSAATSTATTSSSTSATTSSSTTGTDSSGDFCENEGPAFEPESIGPLVVGIEVSITFEGDPLSWHASGDLPDGMTFDSEDGVLSGTPQVLGSYEFIVSASWPEFDPTDGTICTVLPTVQHYTVEVLAVSGETDTDGSTDSDSSSSTTDG